MLRLAADENFNGRIVRALLRRIPRLDLVRIQDSPLATKDDPDVLQWVAKESRILLTHDFATVIGHAYERVAVGQPMPGVIAVRSDRPIGPVVDDLELVVLASSADELANQITYLPF